MQRVKEVIVVEGRSDERAVKRAVDAQVIVTSGFGITEATFRAIATAARHNGVIVLTDPDFMGEKIRERITKRVPGVRHAYLPRELATEKGDIGIENASPESILEALSKVRTLVEVPAETFSKADLFRHGLEGEPGALRRRDALGRLLGIGYGNSRQFLSRLNRFGVTRGEFEDALRRLDEEGGRPE